VPYEFTLKKVVNGRTHLLDLIYEICGFWDPGRRETLLTAMSVARLEQITRERMVAAQGGRRGESMVLPENEQKCDPYARVMTRGEIEKRERGGENEREAGLLISRRSRKGS